MSFENTGSQTSFRWRALGGLGEVGMNCMVFQFGRTALPVDAGVLFADANDFGIEAVYPDYRPLIEGMRPKAWLISHAHEDHIGAVAGLLRQYREVEVPAPTLYAPPFAAALLREKLKEHVGISSDLQNIRTVELDSEVTIEGIRVRFIETRHSTPDSCSLAFEWNPPGGASPLRIFHTADFKLDSNRLVDGVRDVAVFDAFKGQRPDLMFIDSTNSEREGHSVSESEILPGLESLIRESPHRVFLTLFSSNIYRIGALIALGEKHGRKVCLAGRSLQTAHRLAVELGLYGTRCPSIGHAEICDFQDIARYPRERQLVICSGSQGESRSALMRLSQNQHPDLRLEAGDRVIFSSKMIPGNERAVSRLVNGLMRQDAEVLFGDVAKIKAGGPIHASGHARRDEIHKIVSFLKPHFAVPVHGELRQLKNCASVILDAGKAFKLKRENVLVVENNTELEFRSRHILPDEAAFESAWHLQDTRFYEFDGRMLRFEKFTAHSRDPFLRMRKIAAEGGMVSAVLDSAGRARAKFLGVMPGSVDNDMEDVVVRWLTAQYAELKRTRAFDRDDEKLEANLAEDLGRHIRRVFGLRPIVTLHLLGL